MLNNRRTCVFLRLCPSIIPSSSLHTPSASPSLIKAALSPRQFQYIESLAQHLKQNFILHEPGRFVIIPKPYGISCVGYKQDQGGIFPDSVFDKKDTIDRNNKKSSEDISIVDCLPLLSRLFNEPKLAFCTGIKRYMSGAIVLPANEKDFDYMRESIKLSSRGDVPEHHSAIALLLGTPPTSEGTITGYSTFKTTGKLKEYIFVEGKSKKRARAGKFAVQGTMQWKVIDSKYGCSLVHFNINKFGRHLPRLMFCNLLSPILGDIMYSSRISNVDGLPVLISPAAAKRKIQQFFPPELAARLDSSVDILNKQLPFFCHVYQTVFSRYGWNAGKNTDETVDLVASTPPPSHFLSMVEALGMQDSLKNFFQQLDEDETEDTTISGETRFVDNPR